MKPTYVLITPAYNEEAFIEKTLQSVVAQTILPLKWVIVSDGSTDRTDDIVKKYAAGRNWIEFIRKPDHRHRDFASKVHAFNIGYAKVKDLNFDVLGCLDADITFENDYFEYLVEKFKDPNLGVAGTHYVEGEFHSFKNSYINVHHVNGGCQLFRRKCFEDIGGYIPIEGGGIDWVAVTTARMKGWKTYSFGERVFEHHRKIGTAESSILKSRYRYGKKDYFLGAHPLWELFRGLFQMTKNPYVIGGFCVLLGYFWSAARGIRRPVSQDLVDFYQSEQLQRLKGLLLNKSGLQRKKDRC